MDRKMTRWPDFVALWNDDEIECPLAIATQAPPTDGMHSCGARQNRVVSKRCRWSAMTR